MSIIQNLLTAAVVASAFAGGLVSVSSASAAVPAGCAKGNCCAAGACCAMPGCCKVDKSCCDPAKGACTSACGCLTKDCCAPAPKAKAVLRKAVTGKTLLAKAVPASCCAKK